MKTSLRFFLCSITTILTLPASAIIVASSAGSTEGESTLQSYLSTFSYPEFSYWDNLVNISTATGIYLGYNESTQTGWVLSAAHIGGVSEITVASTTYNVISSAVVGTTDMILYQIGGAAMPDLPAVVLTGVEAVAEEFTLMTGRGYSTSGTVPFPWGAVGSPQSTMRWGTNLVTGVETVEGNPYVVVQFDNNPELSTQYEGQGAEGDSGGGLFVLRNGRWELAGIAHFVSSADEISNPSEYGDYTAYSDVYAALTTINSITGTLIPEPSTGLLLALACTSLMIRRRD